MDSQISQSGIQALSKKIASELQALKASGGGSFFLPEDVTTESTLTDYRQLRLQEDLGLRLNAVYGEIRKAGMRLIQIVQMDARDSSQYDYGDSGPGAGRKTVWVVFVEMRYGGESEALG